MNATGIVSSESVGNALWFIIAAASLLVLGSARAALSLSDGTVDLTDAVVVVRPGELPNGEKMAATVLIEETEKRTGIRFPTRTELPPSGVAIVITSVPGDAEAGLAAEGYHLYVEANEHGPTLVRVTGADGRGALFGAGRLLRSMEWRHGSASIPASLNIMTSPAYPIRGHQLGYRNTNNTCDSWNAAQYEQYIRDLAIFGTNSIENIPLAGAHSSPHFTIQPAEMNIQISKICDRYDLDYWMFIPVTFSLEDTVRRAAYLDENDQLFRATPRLNAVFIPGGDPGSNHPRLLLPFVKDLAERLHASHPDATVWISLQGFNQEKTDYFFSYLDEHKPDWFTGVVSGPQSPPMDETRRRLAPRYQHRHYPDITHTVRCQYQVPWWDPAYAFTLGREPVNPQPVYYKIIHNAFAPSTNGFIAYSDGVHDDVNKVVWSVLGWNPDADVRDILTDYARFFFEPDVAQDATDGILALEKNWEGPLAENGAVDGTLALWQNLERRAPQLASKWRWQLCLLRAYYDAYTRHRLIYETDLENRANDALAKASVVGADSAMVAAQNILELATTQPVHPEWRQRVVELCDTLYRSIGFQTSVERYGASGHERGAVLDYLDRPINDRWWYEDQFAEIRQLPREADKLARLDRIRTWENPGPGSFYDDIGDIARSPHLVRGEGINTDPDMVRNPNAGFWRWDDGFSHRRLAWHSSIWSGHGQSGWPLGLRYENLDPEGTYLVRMTGLGEAKLRINGVLAEPTLYGKQFGEFKEYPVPKALLRRGTIVLTFDPIPEEAEVNWRNRSRVTEVWLLRR